MVEIITITIYIFLLSAIMVYCFLELGLAWSYLKAQKEVKEEKTFPEGLAEEDYPMVTIQLPVFNEMYVMERLIDTVAAFDYPKSRLEIQVLDDSTDETLEISRKKVEEYKAKGFDISLHHRVDRSGYKAGALQKGTLVCKGEFIAIFDADFMPHPDFLMRTIPYFDRDDVGVVQSRWQHINDNYSLLTRVQAFFLDAHFTVEQKGRNANGYFINFNGTAGVWRKSTIADAGGWQADTLTEDLDLSYRAQLKGWKFIYREEVLSPAELPADMHAFKSQQFRWIKGGAETARKLLPQVLRSKFPFSVKLNAFTHLLSSSVYVLIFLLVSVSIPLLFVKNTYFDSPYIHYSTPFLMTTVAVAIMYFVSSGPKVYQLKGFLNYLVMLPLFLIVTMGLSLHNALAVLRGFSGEKTPFIRTPKFNLMAKSDNWEAKKNYVSRKLDWLTILEGGMAIYFLVGIAYGIRNMDFSLMPIHIMAFLGFSTVFYYSMRQALTR